MIENTVIIGGGPAGLSAAIYAARAKLSPLVFAGSPAGGQLMLTSQVENYPGFESIFGPELIEKMRHQAKKFGARIIDENVVKVDFSKIPFKVYLTGSATQILSHEAKSIIIATGAKALWLGLESERRLQGKGVSACATCDGFFFRDKIVAVVGGGDTAMEEALTLTKFAKKVYLIHRRDSFRASKIMQERVLNHPKIEIIYNTIVTEVIGKEKVEGIRLKSTKDDSTKIFPQVNSPHSNINSPQNFLSPSSELKVDGLFIAIGHKPDTDIFKGQIEMDKKGYIITTARLAYENLKSQTNLKKEGFNFNYLYQTSTSVSGVFAAGDCVDYQYRQAGVAAGMGIMAALEVEKWLIESKYI